MEKIDVVFYINLDHRTDRREHIEKQLDFMGINPSKIVRISAVSHSVGVIGCVKSHILAVEQFLSNETWKTCMIFEDDFTFRASSKEEFDGKIRTFFDSFEHWDVLALSYNHKAAMISSPTSVANIIRLKQSLTSSCYCLNKPFAPTLLHNFKEGCALKEQHPSVEDYCIDKYWNRLQAVSNWYAFTPALGYQCEGYSDIEKKMVKYEC